MRVSNSGSVGTISRDTFICGVTGGLALAALGEPLARGPLVSEALAALGNRLPDHADRHT
jgi:hypothetical protein